VFTHFPRGEEKTMSYGKFEEEVARFENILTDIRKGDYVLMDESFSSTNHVEASLVAYDVVSALVNSGIFVWYVTFLYDFIRKFLDRDSEHSVLLTPQLLPNGKRSFKLIKGYLTPGYALDLWKKYQNHTGTDRSSV
jgi:hypothetical protein